MILSAAAMDGLKFFFEKIAFTSTNLLTQHLEQRIPSGLTPKKDVIRLLLIHSPRVSSIHAFVPFSFYTVFCCHLLQGCRKTFYGGFRISRFPQMTSFINIRYCYPSSPV